MAKKPKKGSLRRGEGGSSYMNCSACCATVAAGLLSFHVAKCAAVLKQKDLEAVPRKSVDIIRDGNNGIEDTTNICPTDSQSSQGELKVALKGSVDKILGKESGSRPHGEGDSQTSERFSSENAGEALRQDTVACTLPRQGLEALSHVPVGYLASGNDSKIATHEASTLSLSLSRIQEQHYDAAQKAGRGQDMARLQQSSQGSLAAQLRREAELAQQAREDLEVAWGEIDSMKAELDSLRVALQKAEEAQNGAEAARAEAVAALSIAQEAAKVMEERFQNLIAVESTMRSVAEADLEEARRKLSSQDARLVALDEDRKRLRVDLEAARGSRAGTVAAPLFACTKVNNGHEAWESSYGKTLENSLASGRPQAGIVEANSPLTGIEQSSEATLMTFSDTAAESPKALLCREEDRAKLHVSLAPEQQHTVFSLSAVHSAPIGLSLVKQYSTALDEGKCSGDFASQHSGYTCQLHDGSAQNMDNKGRNDKRISAVQTPLKVCGQGHTEHGGGTPAGSPLELRTARRELVESDGQDKEGSKAGRAGARFDVKLGPQQRVTGDDLYLNPGGREGAGVGTQQQDNEEAEVACGRHRRLWGKRKVSAGSGGACRCLFPARSKEDAEHLSQSAGVSEGGEMTVLPSRQSPLKRLREGKSGQEEGQREAKRDVTAAGSVSSGREEEANDTSYENATNLGRFTINKGELGGVLPGAKCGTDDDDISMNHEDSSVGSDGVIFESDDISSGSIGIMVSAPD